MRWLLLHSVNDRCKIIWAEIGNGQDRVLGPAVSPARVELPCCSARKKNKQKDYVRAMRIDRPLCFLALPRLRDITASCYEEFAIGENTVPMHLCVYTRLVS